MSLFYWLQNWCLEHEYVKIKIDTLDNPGWALRVILPQPMPNKKTTHLETSEDDWIHWWIKDHKVNYVGGAKNLTDMLSILKIFIEEEKFVWPDWAIVPDRHTVVNWLEKWARNGKHKVSITSKDGIWQIAMDHVDMDDGEWAWDGCHLTVHNQCFIGHAENGQLERLIDHLYRWNSLQCEGYKESCSLDWLQEWYGMHSQARAEIKQISRKRWCVTIYDDNIKIWECKGTLPMSLARFRAHLEDRKIDDAVKQVTSHAIEHWLENWVASQCDGEWEHDGGVHLCQLEDRIWQLEVDITNMDSIPDEILAYLLSEIGKGKVRIEVTGDRFVGEASVDNLIVLLDAFKEFVEWCEL